jgi:hypothetical protein
MLTRGDYEVSICTRRREAVPVLFRPVLLADWCPKVAECHLNVDRWVEANPGDTAVRGWVTYASFGHAIGLTAHSVVRGKDGQLFDITPLENGNEYLRAGMRFIPHIGDEQAFSAMRELDIYINCSSE